jgi:small subunit ribosomal protein S6
VTRDYELGFILNPEVNEEQTRAMLDRVQQVVENRGGQVMRVNQWGRRRLAYPIERHRDGIYIFVDMVLTPESVIDLDRMLKVSEEVLRHLIRRRDSKIVQKEREEREARAAAATAAAQNAASASTSAPVPTPADAEATAERDGMVSPEVLVSEVQPDVEELPAGEAQPGVEELPAGETPEVYDEVPPTIEESVEA